MRFKMAGKFKGRQTSYVTSQRIDGHNALANRGVDLALWSHRWCQKVLCGVKIDFFCAR